MTTATHDPITSRRRTQQMRAAILALRRWWPQAAFAVQLAARPERHALATVAAVLRQLHEILEPPAGEACPPPAESDRRALPVLDEPKAGCCSESMEQRVAVCHAVLDHLFAGEPTGRADLDGFAAALTTFHLDRPSFDAFVAGLAAESPLRRFATFKSLRQALEPASGGVARIVFRILAKSPDIEPGGHIVRDQVAALGLGITLTHRLGMTAERWRQGRLTIPLDDLLRFKLTEKSFGTLVLAAATDERLDALTRFQTTRAQNLLRGGIKILHKIPGERSQHAAATLVALHETMLERMASQGGAAMREPTRLSVWMRLRSVMHGTRLMAGM